MHVSTRAQQLEEAFSECFVGAPDRNAFREAVEVVLGKWVESAPDRITAFRQGFEMIVQVVEALERARGQSPYALRSDGKLGEDVKVVSTAARDGLQIIAADEKWQS